MTVAELIEELKEYPQDMPVATPYAGADIEKIEIQTWIYTNYPYDLPNKDYVVIS